MPKRQKIKRIIELQLNGEISIDENENEYIEVGKDYQKMLWEITDKIMKDFIVMNKTESWTAKVNWKKLLKKKV